MAIRAYLTTLVSSIQAAESIEEKHKGLRFTKATSKVAENNGGVGEGRRLLLLSTVVAAATDSKTQLLQKYLKKSQENKTKNDKERLDSYYKRNYKDYFAFEEGTLRNKKDLTEAEKGILDWLEANK
nr:photosystem I reaction centre subunit N protein [Tanacetum cinerariifolium]